MQGLRCNCGKMIKPAFSLAKNRVKLVDTNNTASINLGANINAFANLISNSDLRKYQTGNDEVKASSISYGMDQQDGGVFTLKDNKATRSQ